MNSGQYSDLRVKLSSRLQMDPDSYEMDRLEAVVAWIVAEATGEQPEVLLELESRLGPNPPQPGG